LHVLRHDTASGISRFSDFRLLPAFQPHLISPHFTSIDQGKRLDFTSIFTHIPDTGWEHACGPSGTAVKEMIATKKASKLIEQRIGI
jgi:hypothetical protein